MKISHTVSVPGIYATLRN